MSRLRISKRDKVLGSLTVSAEIEWVLNGVGEMKFVMSNNDPKNIEEMLRPGNELYWIDDQLGEWGGHISDDSRDWNAEDGTVTIRGNSAEGLLDLRDTDEAMKLTGTGGSLIRQLVDLTNDDEDTGLRVGNIEDERIHREEQLGDSPLTHAKRIASVERANADFYVTPKLDENNQLTFSMNWLQSGSVETGLILREGQHFIAPRLTEQGPIVNRVRGLGDATTTGTRPVVVVEDDESIKLYGLRGKSFYYDGNKELTTVSDNAENTLAEMKDFRRYLTLGIVDNASKGIANVRDIWATLRLRNAYRVVCTSVGYNKERGSKGLDGMMRLLGMKYFEASQYVEVKGKVDINV